MDTADPSSKIIYNPGSKKYFSKTLHSGEWVDIDCDILPIVYNAMNVAWERGYLPDSQDLGDYSISSINMGWEAPGLSKAEIAIKNLSLKAVKEGEN